MEFYMTYINSFSNCETDMELNDHLYNESPLFKSHKDFMQASKHSFYLKNVIWPSKFAGFTFSENSNNNKVTEDSTIGFITNCNYLNLLRIFFKSKSTFLLFKKHHFKIEIYFILINFVFLSVRQTRSWTTSSADCRRFVCVSWSFGPTE